VVVVVVVVAAAAAVVVVVVYLWCQDYLLMTIIHSRRVCILLIWAWSVSNCIVHVVNMPRSRDLQNIFCFTVFHISTVNIMWTDYEVRQLCVFIGTLKDKPSVPSCDHKPSVHPCTAQNFT
jgi:branched-subunit amino acid ABC-type transport system permease component